MAKADSVHSTPRRTASKIKAKLSATSKVKKSGLDLVPTRTSRGKLTPKHFAISKAGFVTVCT
jgi:hypothetical protein